MKLRFIIAVLILAICGEISTSNVHAAAKIKLKVSKAIVDADSSILATNGSQSVSNEITSRSVNINMPSKTAALYLLKDGEIGSIIAVADCSAKTGKCKSSKVKTTLKAGKNLGVGLKGGAHHPQQRVHHDKAHQNQNKILEEGCHIGACFHTPKSIPPSISQHSRPSASGCQMR